MTSMEASMGMSIRAYARHLGVAHSAVQKAIRGGRIQLEPDGSIDPAKADAAWIANADPARTPKPVPAPPQPRAATSKTPRSDRPDHADHLKPVPQAAVEAARETLKEHGEPVPPPEKMTFMQARTVNEILRAQERRVRLQKLKGELVDKARATALVFRLARQERDAWQNWPSRISAEMAAELGVDANTLHTILERRVRQHLTELSEIRPSFR